MAKRYVVIGLSAAGLAGCEAIRAADPGGEIIAVAGERHLPYSKVLLTHYIAGHIDLDHLFLAREDDLERLRIEVRAGIWAQSLDGVNKQVLLNNGERLAYDALLVATGASPLMPAGILAGTHGVLGLRTLDDAEYIREKALSGARVVILGGGLVGIKLACALCEAGHFPEMVVSSPHVLSQVVDDEAALRVASRMRDRGVRIFTRTDVCGVVASERELAAVQLSGGIRLKCQVLVVCKGVRPNSSFLPRAASGKPGIGVDLRLRSTWPDVYAAGDVAATYEIATGENQIVAIWPHAVEQGRVAGLNMAGQQVTYRGSLARNALEIMGLPLISLGISRPGAGSNWEVKITGDTESYRKLLYRDGKLVGVVLVGRVEEAGRLQAEIRTQNSLT